MIDPKSPLFSTFEKIVFFISKGIYSLLLKTTVMFLGEKLDK